MRHAKKGLPGLEADLLTLREACLLHSHMTNPILIANFPVEYPHVAVLLVSVRKQSTLPSEGTFHVPFHVGHCLEQLQIAIMKETC